VRGTKTEIVAVDTDMPLGHQSDLKTGKRGQAPFVRSTRRAVPAKGACPLFPLYK
jgi:hypothetical protein